MWIYYIPFVFMNDGPQFGYQTIERSTPIVTGADINEIVAHLVHCVNMPNVTTVVPLALRLLDVQQEPITLKEWLVERHAQNRYYD